ncbi:hypothetical protein, partial [Acetivibrio sp. MSJd-27]|uniref:hypothetical protein n=1 Tax=Acetivibrio sp. MSJd-27 TaxID=2841523 RepID=UPI001C124D42
MVYYITTPEHLGLMQKICEERKMNFEFVTNIKDIKLFVNTEIKKLEHIKFFVIDLDCLDNTDKEIYDSICGMRYMTKAKILIVALGRTTGDSLVNALRERNVCKLILSKDEGQAQKETESCLSGTETKEDAPQKVFAEKTINPIAPPVKPRAVESVKKVIPAATKSMITIGVCGIEPHVGTTYHAMAITAFLTKQGKKACYLESNIHGDIQKMLDIYAGSKNSVREDGSILWKGITIYHNYSFLDVLGEGYQFYIYDYGACRDITSQEFAANDIKLLVSGGKPWEFYNYRFIKSKSLRKTKTDAIDCEMIARYLMTVEYKPYPPSFYH